MKHRLILVAVATAVSLAVAGVAGAGESGNKAFKWTDENGVTHYGDTLPPEASTKQREQLNSQGVPMQTWPRQLTPAEQADAQKVAQAESRKAQRDAYLRNTYTSVSDIERLRDERLALIEAQVELARSSLASIDQRLANVQKRMGSFKPYSDSPNARRMPDQLADEAIRTLNEQRSTLGTLEFRGTEKQQVRSEFDSDIERYKELTSRPSR